MSEHVVFYNDRAGKVELDQVTGFDLRAIFMIEPMYEIVVEGEGPHPDRLLRDEDVVQLGERPLRIFGRPPTAFGN